MNLIGKKKTTVANNAPIAPPVDAIKQIHAQLESKKIIFDEN